MRGNWTHMEGETTERGEIGKRSERMKNITVGRKEGKSKKI